MKNRRINYFNLLFISAITTISLNSRAQLSQQNQKENLFPNIHSDQSNSVNQIENLTPFNLSQIEDQTADLYPSENQTFLYPYNDPWTSSLTFALLRPVNLNFKSNRTTLHPERNSVPFVGKSNFASYGIFLSKNKNAPLIFINPGTGGNGIELSSAYIAELLQNKGFSVITLPSTFNFRFALSISRTGLPGYILTDSEDLYHFMKIIFTKLQYEKDIKPKSISLLGYSLGARDAAYLNLIDQKQHIFNFKRIYYINPPLHIRQALNSLDSLFNVGAQWSDSTRKKLMSYVTNKLIDFADHQPTTQEIMNIDKIFRWNDKPFPIIAKQWLIGASFRKNLRDLIYTSQLVNDLAIQKVPATNDLREKRYSEASTFSFGNYLNLFLLPQIKKNYGIESDDFFKNAEFQSAAETSKMTAVTAIVHNSNDFLINSTDIPWIENFSRDSKVYNYGGHMGTLWVPENINHMINFFGPLL